VRARQARRALRGSALFDLGLGVLLLLSGWQSLYAALGLPPARPAIFAELAGVFLMAFAYLLWVAPDYAVLGRRVAEAAAIADGGGAALLLLWLASGPEGIRPLGIVLGIVIALGLAAFAGVQARLSSAP
jgi:hypothetical protein